MMPINSKGNAKVEWGVASGKWGEMDGMSSFE